MKLLVFIPIFLLLTSCHSQPDTLEIKKCIKKHYDRISIQDGSGVYQIESINVNEIEFIKQSKQWVVAVEVSGTYSNPSIPTHDELNKPFKEKKRFLFKQTGKIWQCESKQKEGSEND